MKKQPFGHLGTIGHFALKDAIHFLLPRGQSEVLPDALDDRDEEVDVIEDGEGDQQEVERVAHLCNETNM